VRTCALLLVLLAGCRGAAGEGDGGSDTSGGPIDLPAPRFLEPSGAELHVPTTQHDDVELDVIQVPGATELLVDGFTVGTLDPARPIGALESDVLRLHFAGALLPAPHTLQLRTIDDVETETSELVTVHIDAQPDPGLEATLADPVVAQADGIVVLGANERGVLAIVDGTTSSAVLLTAAGDGWDAARTHTAALPGYVAADDDRVPAIAVTRARDDSDALGIAWRVEHPGVRIDVVTTRWGQSASEPIPALTLDPAWIGSFELAAFGRPLLFDDVLLAELHAAKDVESPRGGDRGLARVRLDDSGRPGAPSRVQLGPVDVDGASAALDPLGALHGGPDTVALRRAGREPVVLEIDPLARTLSMRSGVTGSLDALVGLDGPLATIIGGFGARIVVAATTDPDVLALGLVDDSGALGIVAASIDLAAFDASAPTGPPAVGLLGGAPVVLLPCGADRPVLAIAVVSTEPTVQALPGLACDAVALPQTAAGNAAGTLAVACLRDRELRLGRLVLR